MDEGAGQQSRAEVRRSSEDRIRAVLRACNPVDVLFGPIFQRDMRITGRRRGTYATRAAYLLMLLLIVFFVYLSFNQQMTWGSPASRLQRFQDLAPSISLAVLWTQYFLLGLLSSSLTAGAVSDERRAGTLTTLLSTPLTSAEVVFGKLTGRVTLMVILALSAAPLLLAVRVFGGIDAETILAGTAVALATGILGASFGLLQSTLHKSSTAGNSLAGVMLLAANALPLGLAYAVSHPRFNVTTPEVLATCGPAVLFAMTNDMMGGAGFVGDTQRMWQINIGYNLALSLIAGLAAAGLLRFVVRSDVAGRSPTRKKPRRGARRVSVTAPVPATEPTMTPADASGQTQSEVSVVSPSVEAAVMEVQAESPVTAPVESDAVRESDRDRVVGDNPVLWRELRLSQFRKRWHMIVGCLLVLGIMVAVYVRVGITEVEIHYILPAIGACALLLQAAVQTTSGVAAEREARTLSVLLATPMTSWEILAGKYLGAIRRNWFVFAFLTLHVLIAVLADMMHPLALILIPAVLTGPVMFLTGTGLLLGTLVKRSVTASTLNLLLALCLWLFSWFGLAMIGVAGAGSFADSLANLNFKINPIALAVSSVGGTVADTKPSLMFAVGVMGQERQTEFFALVLMNQVLYGGLGIGAVAVAARYFRPILQRSV